MENNFQRNVEAFVTENRLVGRSYIYDYRIDDRNVEFSIAGEPLSDSLKTAFFANAAKYDLDAGRIVLTEHTIGMSQDEMNALINDVYTRTDAELAEKDARLSALEAQLEAMSSSLDGLQHRADSLAARDTVFQYKLDSLEDVVTRQKGRRR